MSARVFANATHIRPDVPGFTPGTLIARLDLQAARKPLATTALGELSLEAKAGYDTLWVIVRRPDKGAIAIRTIPSTGPVTIRRLRRTAGQLNWRVESPSGAFTVTVQIISDTLVRVTTVLKPAFDLLVAFLPRDVYPLDNRDDPTGAQGWVDAAQRGVNTGLCFFTLDKPAFGDVLYVQNLTALNPYFGATKTKPDGVVGGEWPELGYQPPTSPNANSPPVDPLKADEHVVISDALIAFRAAGPAGENASARRFIDMMADIYPHLDKPETKFRDWLERAGQTVRDLETAPDATLSHYGHTYLHPYTASEYPDSMVQLSVTGALREYAQTRNVDVPLADALMAGVPRFFDKRLGIVRRYLPNVGKDKNADAVDSWYLYHPLMTLGRMAIRGDKLAKRLFLDSMDYAIQAARHFKYEWPIQYDVRDFSVITAARNDDGLGQTDVGGLYAYVMLLAHELTDAPRFLREAKAALQALRGVRFELAYQVNLTAWGAVACARLWRLDGDRAHMDQSLVFVASFLHNCELWNSEIGHAKHYTNFFGVTCLHDAGYMAAYECFEAFGAFDEYLTCGAGGIPPSAHLLLCEFRRYAIDAGWCFYPDALPDDAVAKENIRNGRIERALSFPLEDVYGDGQLAGQVGQEIYGCGGAFVFASRCFFECGGAPFRLFCEYPAVIEQTLDGDALVLRLHGPTGASGRVRLLRKARRTMPRIRLSSEAGQSFTARQSTAEFRDYNLPANGAFRLVWTALRKRGR